MQSDTSPHTNLLPHNITLTLLRAYVAAWLHPSHCYTYREYSAGVTPSRLYTCACAHVNLGLGATPRRLRRLLGDLHEPWAADTAAVSRVSQMHYCIHLIIHCIRISNILNLLYILTIGHIGAPYSSLESSIDP